ncbi:DEAD-box ATP-dependent RNA helicase 39 [Camellia lanceoleosa]|uniref:DEAD-box ATP-dependent RNA helicase 39 n=1 Tax=Camellia lanceoleosa TaxID=1840588 RepID=A0ACC0FQI6_9ERIC|nr:DEAD-box ATP-dependent RNA helicase 39 [Camellia lanceoleosa]
MLPPNPMPSMPSSLPNHHHQHRKRFPLQLQNRSHQDWPKLADEMIGFSVPRKLEQEGHFFLAFLSPPPREAQSQTPQGLLLKNPSNLKDSSSGALVELGISVPTEIQSIGIPAVLEGKSVVLGSHTGSGKTLAYMLPLAQLLRQDEALYGMLMKPRRPQAVVLCPTRELSEQFIINNGGIDTEEDYPYRAVDGTCDQNRGRDKDCILVSFVRSNDSPRNCISSLLGDWHRINVALTHAKKKLIMVGSCKTLSKVPLLKLLIGKVEEQLGILSVSKKDLMHRELKRCSQARRQCQSQPERSARRELYPYMVGMENSMCVPGHMVNAIEGTSLTLASVDIMRKQSFMNAPTQIYGVGISLTPSDCIGGTPGFMTTQQSMIATHQIYGAVPSSFVDLNVQMDHNDYGGSFR